MVQELLGGVGPLPLHHHRLLVAQNGSGSGDGGHVQIRVVLVLPDHVPDASRGGLGILADGGPTGSSRLVLADLRQHHDPFAIDCQLHAHSLAVDEPTVVEGVAGLQVTQSCSTPCDPMDCSRPGFPVLHSLPEFVQTHVH